MKEPTRCASVTFTLEKESAHLLLLAAPVVVVVAADFAFIFITAAAAVTAAVYDGGVVRGTVDGGAGTGIGDAVARRWRTNNR